MSSTHSEQALDLLGIGFGPANLAVCAVFDAMRASGSWHDRRLGMLESKPAFTWHPDMLIDGARMQVSFIKDLVTLKDPTSPLTFINYLHDQGRLVQFLNLKTFYPTRHEFHDYFQWAAEKLDAYVEYDHQVERIEPVIGADGRAEWLEAVTSDASAVGSRRVRARSVSLSLGGRPVLPRGIAPDTLGPQVFHSRSFLSAISQFDNPSRDYRLLVVGGGQSAAEIFRVLAREYPHAKVTLAFRGFSLMPANSSALANEIFNPDMVDLFYNLPRPGREAVMRSLYSTNYAAVDEDDIQAIAELMYEQRVHGSERLRLERFSEVIDCITSAGLVETVIRDVHTGEIRAGRYDGVVFATGYDFRHAEALLAPLEPWLVRDEHGDLAVRRDYSLLTTEDIGARVYLNGNERTHGLTSTLISVISCRADEILASALGDAALAAADRPRLSGHDRAFSPTIERNALR